MNEDMEYLVLGDVQRAGQTMYVLAKQYTRIYEEIFFTIGGVEKENAPEWLHGTCEELRDAVDRFQEARERSGSLLSDELYQRKESAMTAITREDEIDARADKAGLTFVDWSHVKDIPKYILIYGKDVDYYGTDDLDRVEELIEANGGLCGKEREPGKPGFLFVGTL